MWTHQAQRLVRRPIADVREDIERIVDATWRGLTSVTTTEHHGRRADWISDGPGSDDVDIVITWSLTDLDDATFVVVTLDEFEAGPDPREGWSRSSTCWRRAAGSPTRDGADVRGLVALTTSSRTA